MQGEEHLSLDVSANLLSSLEIRDPSVFLLLSHIATRGKYIKKFDSTRIFATSFLHVLIAYTPVMVTPHIIIWKES